MTHTHIHPEKIAAHVAKLQADHDALAQEIEKLEHIHGVDNMEVHRLKKEKFALKEQIEKIKSGMIDDIIA